MYCVTEMNLIKPEIAGGMLVCGLQANAGDGLDLREIVSEQLCRASRCRRQFVVVTLCSRNQLLLCFCFSALSGDSCKFCWEDNDSIFTQLLVSVVMAFVLFIVHVDTVCMYIYTIYVRAYIRTYKRQRCFILKLVCLPEEKGTVLGDAEFF